MSERPGSTPMPTNASRPGGLPVGGHLELAVAQLLARELERLVRVRVGQRHGHVHVVHAGLVAGIEDGHDEARIHRVEDVGDAVLTDERDDRCDVRRIHPGAAEARVAGHLRERVLHAGGVVVRHHDVLEEVAPGRDGHGRGADATGADDEDAHVLDHLWRADGGAHDPMAHPPPPLRKGRVAWARQPSRDVERPPGRWPAAAGRVRGGAGATAGRSPSRGGCGRSPSTRRCRRTCTWRS